MKRIHLPDSDIWIEFQEINSILKFNVYPSENSCIPRLRGEKRPGKDLLITSKTIGISKDMLREVDTFLTERLTT